MQENHRSVTSSSQKVRAAGDTKDADQSLKEVHLTPSSDRYWTGTKSKSRSLLSSPTNIGSANVDKGNRTPRCRGGIDGRFFGSFRSSSSSVPDESYPSKSKKWYSFTSLLSRSTIRGFLTPRSRLSVSSIFSTANSESDVTPTGLPDFGFPGCTHHQIVPASPSPSCVTVSGEFPSRSSGSCSGSVVFRKPRYSSRSYSITGPAVIDEVPKEGRLEREGSYRQRTRAHRVSCGDFYPGSGSGSSSAASPGFLGLDFQFHSYSRNGPGKGLDGFQPQPKRTIGRSLPILLEAMESSKDGREGPFRGGGGSPPCQVTVESVSELLYQEYLVLTGSKTLDDHYLLLFPDRGNFHQLGDEEYKMLVKYLVSIPPMQDVEAGFVVIIDRRNDKWNSVKTTLLKISGYFPGVIHRVFVLRPLGFLQKALSEVSSKLFRNENLRFRLTVCNQVSDLLTFVDPSQLTLELGGSLQFDKIQWVRERVEVESFHAALQNLSRDLKTFTEAFRDMEYPNDAGATEGLIRHRTTEFSALHSDLLKASEHGEKILKRIKGTDNNTSSTECTTGLPETKSSVQLVNVIHLERFIVQIEETTNLFQEFWDKELLGLERCLLLRRFEHGFRELQITFNLHVKSLNGIPEMGETLFDTDELISETVKYQDLTRDDLSSALSLEAMGREIVSTNPSAVDTVEPKCLELSRMASHFRFILQEKLTRQNQWREVQITIEKANNLCRESVDLLNSQQMTESLEEAPDWNYMKTSVDDLVVRIQTQVADLVALKMTLTLSSVSQSKTLLKQVLKRVEEAQGLVRKRQLFLAEEVDKKQSVVFKTRRSSGSCFDSNRSSKAFSEDASDGSSLSSMTKASLSSTNSSDGSIANGKSSFEEEGHEKRVKRFHVLQELLQTEQTYVEEIGLILTGYRNQVTNPEVQGLVPFQLVDPSDKTKAGPNVSVLFCNLEEIYAFHSKIFLPDLTASLGLESIELVALCFIQRHSDFLAMYNEYCQLKGASDTLLKEIGEGHPWLSWCQEKLGHRLALSSYLLKPVQRITKYHLLLGNLVKYSQSCHGHGELLEAVDCMVVVVRSVNDGMHQLQIRGYPAKLSAEGPLLLQGQFTVWIETTKNRLSLKCHQRYLFLYRKSILVCKKTGAQSSLTYEFKSRINLSEVGLTEEPKGSNSAKKFEIWIQGRQEVFLFQAATREVKGLWVTEIKKLLMEQLQYLREVKGCVTPSSLSSEEKKTPRFAKVNTLNGYWSQPSHMPMRHSSFDGSSLEGRPRSCSALEADLEDDLYGPS